MMGLRTLLRGYARVDRAATRVQKNIRQFTGAILCTALTPAEQSDLSIAVYDALSRPRAAADKPHPFEVPWWQEVLPAPRARILVGACGDGREVVALRNLGYQVDGFEPARTAAATCRRRAADDSTIAVATYEQFAAAVRGATAARARTGHEADDLPSDGEAESGDLRSIARTRYDAVLLGWGSLGHVLDSADRAALVAACHAVCPDGPILATFWLGNSAPPRGRAGGAGLALGRRIARARGIDDASDGLSFGSWYGFNHLFTSDEIEALGATTGRTTRWGDASQYPHAAWLVANENSTP